MLGAVNPTRLHRSRLNSSRNSSSSKRNKYNSIRSLDNNNVNSKVAEGENPVLVSSNLLKMETGEPRIRTLSPMLTPTHRWPGYPLEKDEKDD